MKRLALLSIWLALPLALAGCTNWERTTFNTLSTSKATLDTLQADYEAGCPATPVIGTPCLPHNTLAYNAITKAKDADTLAVNAMVVYEEEKAAGTDLTQQQQIVTTELAELPALIADVQALFNKGGQ